MPAVKFGGVEVLGLSDIADDRGKWLIHGPQGSGKTTLASTIAEVGKTLFIDLTGEKGIRSFKGAPYAKNIDVIRPKSAQAFDDIFWSLNAGGHGYKAVVVDSLTGLQKMTMRFMLGHSETAVREIRQGTAPADQRTWGQTLDIMTDVATFWYGLADGDRQDPMHVVMTAQTKIIDDEVMGTRNRTPDVQKGALSISLAAPDYIVYCDFEASMDEVDSDGQPVIKQIVRFGSDPDYRTKARIPVHLRGKLPSVLGRKTQPNLTTLSRVLEIGGITVNGTTAAATKKESTNA